jgi:hypothetical protein
MQSDQLTRTHPAAHDSTNLGDHPEDVTHASVDATMYRRPHELMRVPGTPAQHPAEQPTTSSVHRSRPNALPA